MTTRGTFGVLPPMDDGDIEAQLRYAIDRGWAISVEHTDDPHPRNQFWEMWALPLFDITDPSDALTDIAACRQAHPDRYVKVNAFDSTRGRETIALSFLVQRPTTAEAASRLERQHAPGRTTRYTLHP